VAKLHQQNGGRYREAGTLACLADTYEAAGDLDGADDARRRVAASTTRAHA